MGWRARSLGLALIAGLLTASAAHADPPRTLWLSGMTHGHHASGHHPLAVVHASPELRPGEPFGLVVVFHGWNSCASTVMGWVRPPCTREGGMLEVARQIDRLGMPLLVVVPQLAFEQRTTEPGRFAIQGEFRAFLEEVLARSRSLVGDVHLDRVRGVVLASHSAGYATLASVLVHRDIPNLRAAVLLDSLYNRIPDFAAFGRSTEHRLFVVAGSSTRRETETLAEMLEVPIQRSRTARTARLGGRVVVLRTPLGHEDIARAFLGPIVAEVMRP